MQRIVVGGQAHGRPRVAEQQRDAGVGGVGLRAPGQRVGLDVGALDQPHGDPGRGQALRVGRRAAQVGLDGGVDGRAAAASTASSTRSVTAASSAPTCTRAPSGSAAAMRRSAAPSKATCERSSDSHAPAGRRPARAT